jgi:hypothetical protein
LNYTALAAKATTLVANAGRAITFVRLEETPTDSAKPWRGATDSRSPPDATQPANGVAVEPSSVVALGIATVDTDFIKRAEQIFIVTPAADDLDTYDELIDGATRWRINEVQKLRPADVTLLYFVSVRR